MASANIVMPDRADLARRLRMVDGGEHLPRFYDKILKQAGRTLNGGGVAVSLTVAVEEYRVEARIPADIVNRILLQLCPTTYARSLEHAATATGAGRPENVGASL